MNFEFFRPFRADTFVMRCGIWYDLYNLKNVKSTHGGVLILVKLQAEAMKISMTVPMLVLWNLRSVKLRQCQKRV